VKLADWTRLLTAAIERAEKTNDPRLVALKAATTSGKTIETLKKYGIICEADIQREFR
jgi:hypothetical protein